MELVNQRGQQSHIFSERSVCCYFDRHIVGRGLLSWSPRAVPEREYGVRSPLDFIPVGASITVAKLQKIRLSHAGCNLSDEIWALVIESGN